MDIKKAFGFDVTMKIENLFDEQEKWHIFEAFHSLQVARAENPILKNLKFSQLELRKHNNEKKACLLSKSLREFRDAEWKTRDFFYPLTNLFFEAGRIVVSR